VVSVLDGASLFQSRENSEQKAYPSHPPPNVTGVLSHRARLNNTLQDILIRLKRMQGYNALWMPGTDHAGSPLRTWLNVS